MKQNRKKIKFHRNIFHFIHLYALICAEREEDETETTIAIVVEIKNTQKNVKKFKKHEKMFKNVKK